MYLLLFFILILTSNSDPGAIISDDINNNESEVAITTTIEQHPQEQEQEQTVFEEHQEIPRIPKVIDSVIANLKDPYTPKKDIPFFWHIPKSGGTSIKNMYSQCYNMVEASETGAYNDPSNSNNNYSDIIKVVEVEEGRYVNVDVTIDAGIDHAAKLKLVESNLADIIVSPLFHKASTTLFPSSSSEHKGRLMAVFRDPIDRIISLYYYLQKATWEPTYNPIFQNMTLEQFAFSPYCESNFVGRSLINKMEEPLTVTDVEVSKMILKEKCLIGLLSDLPTSIKRFDSYFGFIDTNKDVFNVDCQNEYIKKGVNRKTYSKDDVIVNNSNNDESLNNAIEEIKRKNWLDIILYQYSIELFHQQGIAFFSDFGDGNEKSGADGNLLAVSRALRGS